jgi:hypothetical protein
MGWCIRDPTQTYLAFDTLSQSSTPCTAHVKCNYPIALVGGLEQKDSSFMLALQITQMLLSYISGYQTFRYDKV